jgi:non-ribosomal peptide synthetase component F
MYKTGDLGQWRADGSIDILGRADDQVKIKVCRLSNSDIFIS